jgi:hypothetical protein
MMHEFDITIMKKYFFIVNKLKQKIFKMEEFIHNKKLFFNDVDVSLMFRTITNFYTRRLSLDIH